MRHASVSLLISFTNLYSWFLDSGQKSVAESLPPPPPPPEDEDIHEDNNEGAAKPAGFLAPLKIRSRNASGLSNLSGIN